MNRFDFHIDIPKIENVAQNIQAVQQSAASKQSDGLAASRSLFDIFEQHSVESALIFTSHPETLQSIKDQKLETYQLIESIKRESIAMNENIAPMIFAETKASTYVQQFVALNKNFLAADHELFSNKDELLHDFRRFQSLVMPLKEALGYVDWSYSSDFSREDFWPNAEYFQGQYNYLNLFRASEPEKAKSITFNEVFDTLSEREQLAAYAWIYHASFEEFLAVSAIPNELPPWITSQALRDLHAKINNEYMSKFEAEEAEMLEL
ncbi:hypothetical protein PN836_006000 [Ningiella sp. W23]|uniref:hypothetical protein n=1 Tax=Ningiella sp. W23 TaxID=3023715 RepID=UPI0037570DDE